MTPRLECCYFTTGADDQWSQMAHVLAHSAATHCQSWEWSIVQLPKDTRQSPIGIDQTVHNTRKLEYWCGIVQSADSGSEILLIDADTMILRALDDIWDQPFDLAYTVKRRPPFNLGVVFVRVTAKTRAFFSAWQAENDRIFREPGRSPQAWLHRFGGVNQASFGALLERVSDFGLQLCTLPCLEWNCEDSTWQRFDPNITRIVHLKGELRRMVFGRATVSAELRPLVRLWRSLQGEAISAPREVASA